MITIDEEDFGILAICAERYALGRQTYMPSLVCKIIENNLSQMTKKDIQVLINDIESPLAGSYGDDCDKVTWMKLLKELKEMQC